MNCSLSKTHGLIGLAITALMSAILAAWLWMTALPLFVAAGLVASVIFYFIPKIREAIDEYVKCRGPSDWCSVRRISDALAQVVALLGAVAFTAAGLIQLAALAAVASYILYWVGVGMMVAVKAMVVAGTFACALAVFWLIHVITETIKYRSCMDNRQPDYPPRDGGVLDG